jgi:hypothetical protein
VIDRETGAAATTIEKPTDAVSADGEVESVTRMVKLEVPEAVGVPESAPEGESVSPAGRDPELTVQT